MTPWPVFENDEIQAAADILKSGKVNYWTGSVGKQFETEFAQYIGLPHAIALSNGTVALELALHAIGIGPGDEVIVPCRTFLATASAVVAKGGVPIVADIDLNSQCLSAHTIQPWITPKTKAIIVVHLAGFPADMDPILELARQRGLFVIEDCAQAHGAIYKGRKVGSLGDIAAFSFCQDKIMTTGGEGGMVVTASTEYWKRMWQYKDHGKDPDLCAQPGTGKFRWLHTQFGSNWRLTEMQSAIGIKQLEKLERWIETRNQHADVFVAMFRQFQDIAVPELSYPDSRHSYYKFYIRLKENAPVEREILMEKLHAFDIPCLTGSCFNISFEKAFGRFPSQFEKDLPNAKVLGRNTFLLAVDPSISISTIRHQASCIQSILIELGFKKG